MRRNRLSSLSCAAGRARPHRRSVYRGATAAKRAAPSQLIACEGSSALLTPPPASPFSVPRAFLSLPSFSGACAMGLGNPRWSAVLWAALMTIVGIDGRFPTRTQLGVTEGRARGAGKIKYLIGRCGRLRSPALARTQALPLARRSLARTPGSSGEPAWVVPCGPTRWRARASCARGPPSFHVRNGLNEARTSSVKIFGCSHAAKWQPLGVRP